MIGRTHGLSLAPVVVAAVCASLGSGCHASSADDGSSSQADEVGTSEDGLDGSDSGESASEDTSTDTATDTDTSSESEGDESTDTGPGPDAACEGPGGGGHIQLVAAYWAATAAFGDFITELVPAIQAGHVDLPRLAQPLPDDVDIIVDLHWELFDYTNHTVRADLEAQIDVITAAVDPVLGRVRAFYLIDEPYVSVHMMPRQEIEKAIAALEDRFPGVPTYVTFAHHCFDPESVDPACVVPGENRGIPAGLDWVGFDWYNDSNDLAVAATHVPTNIATGIDRIVQLDPAVKVMVVPEAYTDGNRLETTAVATLYDYFTLAAQHPAVFGVDFFLWADAPAPENYQGMRSLPAARAAARSFARWVRKECGDVAELVPVTQWYSAAGPDHRYEPWVWDGRAEGYRVDGVAFALAPTNAPDTVPLVHCLIDRGSSVDSFLTLDAGCEGALLAVPAAVIGGIYPTEKVGTVQLHRYAQQQAPWDHVYSVSDNAPLPADYGYEWAIGWVYPASAL